MLAHDLDVAEAALEGAREVVGAGAGRRVHVLDGAYGRRAGVGAAEGLGKNVEFDQCFVGFQDGCLSCDSSAVSLLRSLVLPSSVVATRPV